MSVDGEAVRLADEAQADEPGWEVDPDDEWGLAVVATVGRQFSPLRPPRGAASCRTAPAEAGGRREDGPRVGQLAYVSNSAMRGVPEALVISRVIFFREAGEKLTVPAPLPEARTAPVSWLSRR